MKVPRIHLFALAVLMLGCVLAAAAQEPRLVMAQAPDFMGLCLDANLYIVSQGQIVIACDMDSGNARWTYDDWPPGMYLHEVPGKQNVFLFGGRDGQIRIVVLKKASGEVVWKYEGRTSAMFRGARPLKDSDWFVVYYARGKPGEGHEETEYCELYSPDGKGPYPVPQDMWPREWQEEGKTLVLTANEKEAIRVLLWDLESNTTQDQCGYQDGQYGGRLHNGGLLVSRYYADREPHFSLKVVDGHTGRLLRDVASPGDIESAPLIQDGRTILIMGEKAGVLWMLDADTDAVLVELRQPGHEFDLSSVRKDASGRIWIVSQDAEGHRYLWPVEAGAVPRKVYDKGPFISGDIFKVDPPIAFTSTYGQGGAITLRGVNFEERRVVAEWKPSRQAYNYDVQPSHTMRRCVATLPGSDEAQRHGGRSYEILDAGAAEPLMRIQDARMLILSPDGEYLVTQAIEDRAVLMHVSTSQTLYEFPLDEEQDWTYAVFAADSRTVAVYGGFDAYEVVRISEEGCTETPLEFRMGTWLSSQCFSPDGTRLLSATRGKAWLHDTTTGRLLHTLTEAQQLRSQYVRAPEVFGIKMPFVNYLGDLTGNFTNLANSKPVLQTAFIGDGPRLLTVAEAQMIRVWDSQTGRSVHTIEAGLSNTRNEYGYMENEITLSRNSAYAMASNPNDSQAILWDVNSGRAAKKYTDWKRDYRVMHVSDDGKCIYLDINNSLYWLEGR